MKKWDTRFMRLAREVSSWSKNAGIKIGVVIVNPERRIIGTGYNGFPAKLSDSSSNYENNTIKHLRMIHGEMNAIFNSVAPLANGTMYVYGCTPCAQCAGAIIQNRISRVLVHSTVDTPRSWKKSVQEAKSMFNEAGIPLININQEMLTNDRKKV